MYDRVQGSVPASDDRQRSFIQFISEFGSNISNIVNLIQVTWAAKNLCQRSQR